MAHFLRVVDGEWPRRSKLLVVGAVRVRFRNRAAEEPKKDHKREYYEDEHGVGSREPLIERCDPKRNPDDSRQAQQNE